MFGKKRLSADEIRNVEEGDYLVVDLREDEYWEQGEGRVEFVTEYDSGVVHVGILGSSGHTSRLKVPADARTGLEFDGVADGANGLRVDGVYEKNKD